MLSIGMIGDLNVRMEKCGKGFFVSALLKWFNNASVSLDTPPKKTRDFWQDHSYI
jgi:hypothetical protein